MQAVQNTTKTPTAAAAVQKQNFDDSASSDQKQSKSNPERKASADNGMSAPANDSKVAKPAKGSAEKAGSGPDTASPPEQSASGGAGKGQAASGMDAPANDSKIAKPASGGAEMQDVPTEVKADTLKADAKSESASTTQSDDTGARQTKGGQVTGDEVSGRTATEQVLNDARIGEEAASGSKTEASGADALRQSIQPRLAGLRDDARAEAEANGEEFDAAAFNVRVKDSINAYGKAIDAVNTPDVQSVDDVKSAIGDLETVEGRDALETSDGKALSGFAYTGGEDGKGGILLNNALEGDPDALKSAATEELGERFFQSTFGGTSKGDFGAEVAGREAGTLAPGEAESLRNMSENDGAQVAGVGEGEAAPAAVIILGVELTNFAINQGLSHAGAKVQADIFADQGGSSQVDGFWDIGLGVSSNVPWSTHRQEYWGEFKGGGRETKILRKTVSAAAYEVARSADKETLKKLILNEPGLKRPAGGWTIKKVTIQRHNSSGKLWIKPTYEKNQASNGPPANHGARGGGGPSDRRIKQDIERLAHMPDLGIDLYSWRYRNDDPTRYVGVMAQDLLARPDLAHAVSEAKTGEFAGFWQVDYAALGLAMTTEADWTARGERSVRVASAA